MIRTINYRFKLDNVRFNERKKNIQRNWYSNYVACEWNSPRRSQIFIDQNGYRSALYRDGHV